MNFAFKRVGLAAGLVLAVLVACAACVPQAVLPVVTGVAGFAIDHRDGIQAYFDEVRGVDGIDEKAKVTARYYCLLRESEPDLADAVGDCAAARLTPAVIGRARNYVGQGCDKLVPE